MSLDQVKQVRRLREIWPLRVAGIFKPSGSPYDSLVLLLMIILSKSKTVVEYGAHTGHHSALIAAMTDVVNGKFTGVDDWSYFGVQEEKAKSLIESHLNFLDIKNYEIVNFDCNSSFYIESEFHFWDVCRSSTPDNLVRSIHHIIENAKSNFTICIDDVVREHPFGNKEFLKEWQHQFHKLAHLEISLVTENKLYLSNYKVDSKLTDLLVLLSNEKIIPHTSYDKFYNCTKYVGSFFDVADWSSRIISNDSFWNKLEDIFKS